MYNNLGFKHWSLSSLMCQIIT